VDQGVLHGALLSTYSARRLGQRSTGNASGCYNLQLSSRHSAATDDQAAMLRKLGTGLFVTGLSGEGVRLINGDYSRVARGFWVEGGEIVHAVDGLTIAGNLLDMWQQIVAVGTDTFTSGALSSGSILVAPMRVAAP
jgi:PmbA protein